MLKTQTAVNYTIILYNSVIEQDSFSIRFVL